MSAVTARLVDDRFTLDDPTDEDGSKPTLALEEDQADEPGPEEQARLEAVLERGRAQIERGEYVSAKDFHSAGSARNRRSSLPGPAPDPAGAEGPGPRAGC